MKKLVLASGLTLALLTVAAPRALGQDRDCRDFATQQEAQRFFEAAGPGDPHRLDADNDGIACENRPRRGTARQRAPDSSTEAVSGSATPPTLPMLPLLVLTFGLALEGACWALGRKRA